MCVVSFDRCMLRFLLKWEYVWHEYNVICNISCGTIFFNFFCAFSDITVFSRFITHQERFSSFNLLLFCICMNLSVNVGRKRIDCLCMQQNSATICWECVSFCWAANICCLHVRNDWKRTYYFSVSLEEFWLFQWIRFFRRSGERNKWPSKYMVHIIWISMWYRYIVNHNIGLDRFEAADLMEKMRAVQLKPIACCCLMLWKLPDTFTGYNWMKTENTSQNSLFLNKK